MRFPKWRILSALLGLALCGSGVAIAQGGTFLEPFTGAPATPQPYPGLPGLAAWDVTVHSRDPQTFYALEPMLEDHGPNCEAPPAQRPATQRYEDAVFQCSNHIMTSIMAGGYAVVYLTPPAILDWSAGTATVTFDMSTLRTSARDWIDVWVSPYDTHRQLPLELVGVDLNGPPQEAVHIKMDSGSGTIFRGQVFHDFSDTGFDGIVGGDIYTGLEFYVTRSAAVRTTFQLILSRTHIKFGMPALDHWWVDSDIPDIGFSQGVVQFGHHSYNPQKECGVWPPECVPDTWHWDNVALNPSIPFTITRANERYVDPTTAGNTFTFPVPAPAGAMLQFAALSDPASVQYSQDAGATWQAAAMAVTQPPLDPSKFQSYWTPIQEGVQAVQVRGLGGWWGSWMVRDASVWSQVEARPPTRTPVPVVPPTATSVPPTPTRTATPFPPTVTPGPTATELPTATPLPVPTAVPTGAPTATLVPGPQCAQVAIVNGGLTWNPQAPSACPQQ